MPSVQVTREILELARGPRKRAGDRPSDDSSSNSTGSLPRPNAAPLLRSLSRADRSRRGARSRQRCSAPLIVRQQRRFVWPRAIGGRTCPPVLVQKSVPVGDLRKRRVAVRRQDRGGTAVGPPRQPIDRSPTRVGTACRLSVFPLLRERNPLLDQDGPKVRFTLISGRNRGFGPQRLIRTAG